jgi:hypothetical protein
LAYSLPFKKIGKKTKTAGMNKIRLDDRAEREREKLLMKAAKTLRQTTGL